MRKFLCIGHRGAKGLEPENTLRSVRRALRLGVDGVEVDVYFVDGELIVIHDDTLKRTTNGRGRVEERSFDSLRLLNAGKGEKIPTLREVFDTVGGRAFINVELKGGGTAGPVLRLIGEYLGAPGWAKKSFLVSSFNHGELAKLCGKGIRLGALFSGKADYVPVARSLGAYSINIASWLVDEGVVAATHEAGMKIFVYTINSAEMMARLAAIGVDGIFTDRPDRFPTSLRKP